MCYSLFIEFLKGTKNMLHITICDDEQTQLTLLESFVTEWARLQKYEPEINLCQNADQFLFWQEEKKEPDIILLDIDMPGMDGLSLARKLRSDGRAAQIIFITGLTDYVLEGYDVEAVSYLIKPVKKERLFSCLDKAKERCGRQAPTLLLETPGGAARIKLADICYLESDAHDTQVHFILSPNSPSGNFPHAAELMNTCPSDAIRCKTGIHELEIQLQAQSRSFFKIHRSYLVNLSYVSKITRKDVLMDTGEILPVARGRWEALNKAYLDYYRQKQV